MNYFQCVGCELERDCPLKRIPMEGLRLNGNIDLLCCDLVPLYVKFREIGEAVKNKKKGGNE